MEDIKTQEEEANYQQSCNLCKSLTPRYTDPVSLASWLVSNEWVLVQTSNGRKHIYCKKCTIEIQNCKNMSDLNDLLVRSRLKYDVQ